MTHRFLLSVILLFPLSALRCEGQTKNIGVPGLMVLSPIINEKAVDEWVMGELL